MVRARAERWDKLFRLRMFVQATSSSNSKLIGHGLNMFILRVLTLIICSKPRGLETIMLI